MTSYLRSSQAITGKLSDELVMMDIDRGVYFSLNHVATRIWELLEVPMTIDDICRRLEDEFEADRSQCRSDVEQFIARMVDTGLIIQV